MGHRIGENREQGFLFPVSLDELVEADSLVRVIDAWATGLDTKKLGFAKAQTQHRGAPPYDPADLLKLYLWGYLNAVRSSRRLERECQRNVECMWLLRRLAPDHKTIAEFRRLNADALVATCAYFIQFAREQRLIGGLTVAVDGTKLRAVSSRKTVVSQRQLKEQAKKNLQEIAAYMKVLDEQDSKETSGCKPEDVRAALEQLKTRGAAIEEQLQQLKEAGVKTLVKSEPQAQAMYSLQGAPGYNLQTAVEAESHLIVHHELNSEANDQRQLKSMAEGASRVLGSPCIAVADAGYANGEQIAALDDQNITTYVAENRAVNNNGLLDRRAFSFDAEQDRFTCPQGNELRRKRISIQNQAIVYEASPKDCGSCPIKGSCTNAAKRSVTRHLHEEALVGAAERVKAHPEMMDLRRQVVEHPFADLKHRILGNARLLMRGIRGATGEISMAVLVYNIKRVFNMKGGAWMHQALQA
jgi:transposase